MRCVYAIPVARQASSLGVSADRGVCPYIWGRVESVTSRRVHVTGCTADPNGAWVTQQARQFIWSLQEQPGRFRFLIRDRDSKFTRDFDAVFASEGIEIIKMPVRAPKENAFAERFVRTARAECFDWLLIMNRRHPEHVLRTSRGLYRPISGLAPGSEAEPV